MDLMDGDQESEGGIIPIVRLNLFSCRSARDKNRRNSFEIETNLRASNL